MVHYRPCIGGFGLECCLGSYLVVLALVGDREITFGQNIVVRHEDIMSSFIVWSNSHCLSRCIPERIFFFE
jgi:hypothetical protein